MFPFQRIIWGWFFCLKNPVNFLETWIRVLILRSEFIYKNVQWIWRISNLKKKMYKLHRKMVHLCNFFWITSRTKALPTKLQLSNYHCCNFFCYFSMLNWLFLCCSVDQVQKNYFLNSKDPSGWIITVWIRGSVNKQQSNLVEKRKKNISTVDYLLIKYTNISCYVIIRKQVEYIIFISGK